MRATNHREKPHTSQNKGYVGHQPRAAKARDLSTLIFYNPHLMVIDFVVDRGYLAGGFVCFPEEQVHDFGMQHPQK